MAKIEGFTAQAGLERVSILITIVHEVLGYYDREDNVEYDLHPCIQSDEAKQLVGRIGDDLADLYQLMGHQMVQAEEMK